MIRVFFSLVPCLQAEWEGEPYRTFVMDLFNQQKAPGFAERYALAADADAADLVIILEPSTFKRYAYGEILKGMPSVQKHPEKIFTANYDDGPLAFFPGIYAAMPAQRFEQGFTIATGYLANSPNQFVRQAHERSHSDVEYLFTFLGALSSSVRQRMFRARSLICSGPHKARFTMMDAWFNHSEEQKRDYVDEILKSKFVLCPRGQGTASYRLFEVMELGRVPVIIADDWVEPVGPRWAEFSFRLAESDIRSIPKFLSDRESAFPLMAKMARAAWEEFFAPDVRLSRMLSLLESLKVARIGESNDYRSRWNDPGFFRGNVGTLWSRFRRRLGLNKS